MEGSKVTEEKKERGRKKNNLSKGKNIQISAGGRESVNSDYGKHNKQMIVGLGFVKEKRKGSQAPENVITKKKRKKTTGRGKNGVKSHS